MQNQITIVDSKDGRILMSVDGCTLRALIEAVAAKPEQRLDEFRAAVQSYHEYKRAQAVVAAYERPERIAAIKETFLGRNAKK